MRGRFTIGLLLTVSLAGCASQPLPTPEASIPAPRVDGIAQVAAVTDPLTGRPRQVLCGEGVPCPAPTLKQIDWPAPAPMPAAALRQQRYTINFPFDRARLTPQARRALAAALPAFQAGGPIRVEAYTDAIGTNPYNDRLARKRAAAVRAFLLAHGIPADRIALAADGKCCYVASNQSASGRAANRRAEVSVVIQQP